MNKFEQVSSLAHQMSLAGGRGPDIVVPFVKGEGGLGLGGTVRSHVQGRGAGEARGRDPAQ